MAYKVGDRVMVYYNETHWCSGEWHKDGYKFGEPGTIMFADIGEGLLEYYVELDAPRGNDNGWWWVSEGELKLIARAIPEGWTPADTPPSNERNVEIMFDSGKTGYGWIIIGGESWLTFDNEADLSQIKTDPEYAEHVRRVAADDGVVIAWRDIEPIAAKDNENKTESNSNTRSDKMKNLFIFKAQSFDGPVEGVRINIKEQVPDFDSIEEQDKAFSAQAKVLEDFMYQSLPGGLYDRLLGLMLSRKSTHFRVSHANRGES